MLIKRIISTAAIMGVLAAFAVAGSPLVAASKKPFDVTVFGNYNNSPPVQVLFIPGPDRIE